MKAVSLPCCQMAQTHDLKYNYCQLIYIYIYSSCYQSSSFAAPGHYKVNVSTEQCQKMAATTAQEKKNIESKFWEGLDVWYWKLDGLIKPASFTCPIPIRQLSKDKSLTPCLPKYFFVYCKCFIEVILLNQ